MARLSTSIIPLMLLATGCGTAAAAVQDVPDPEVTVIQAGGTVMYKYRDSTGQIVVQDRPPPGYYEQLEPDPQPEAASEPQQPAVDSEPPPQPLWQRLITAALWWLPPVALIAGLYILVAPFVRARLSESALERSLRKAGYPAFFDIAVTDGSRRRSRIDCVACTPSGLLVLGVCRLSGQLDGTAGDAKWTATTNGSSHSVDNPLVKNAADTRLVQELTGDVAVHGRVVNIGRAKFSSGIPTRLHRLATLRAGLPKFAEPAAGRRELEGGWRILMRFPRSNPEPPRILGTGWQTWLRKHWRRVAGGSLITLAATSAAALVMTNGV